MSDSVRSHRRQPTRLPRPWDSPGKNTGVGCHFLLQCVKVKSESEVAQSCPTLSDPMDCSLPGSSVHEIFQARVLEWGAIAFLSTFPGTLLVSGGLLVPYSLSGSPVIKQFMQMVTMVPGQGGRFRSVCFPQQKDWCWSWSSNTLAWCKEPTHWKDPDAGKDWGQEEKWATEDEMVEWHHWLNGHESEQTPGDTEG